MAKNPQLSWGICLGGPATIAIGLLMTGCGESHHHDHGSSSNEANKIRITNVGSSTMFPLATAWADAYTNVEPAVSVKVDGGGSDKGIVALISGSCDLANSSRQFQEKEMANFKSKHSGKEPKEFLVGYDALCVFVHKDNPLEEISMEELQQLYMKDGKISKWSELGVTNIPGAKVDEVVLVGRDYISSTYDYFREAIVGETNEMRPGTLSMDHSEEVVEIVATKPNAIGYARMGDATSRVKYLRISRKKGEKAVESPIATPLDKTYPIARALFMYTAGEPAAHVKKYLDWILSDAGQKIVEQTGYVRLPK